jgi:hypothetical protein
MKSKALIPLVIAVAAFQGSRQSLSAEEKTNGTERGYLGVVVASAHPALAANLKDVLSPEQGLTIEDVGQNSPATKAGLKIHDVLTAYADQKLFSVEQFAKLVRSDPPGREVSIEYLRDGKLERVKATLAKLDPSDFRVWTPSSQAQPYRFGQPDRIPRRFLGRPTPAGEWDTFDSMTLKKLGDDKFHAELQHVDKQGKTHQHVFDGSREEIRAGMAADKQLQPAERAHLLRALNMHLPTDDVPLPHIWFEPGLGWYFEQPGGPFH